MCLWAEFPELACPTLICDFVANLRLDKFIVFYLRQPQTTRHENFKADQGHWGVPGYVELRWKQPQL